MDSTLKTLFTYQTPDVDAIQNMAAIRAKAFELAELIDTLVPKGSDRSASIRHVREAVFTANAGIVLNGVNY